MCSALPCEEYDDASQAVQLETEAHNEEKDTEDGDHQFLEVHHHVYEEQYPEL